MNTQEMVQDLNSKFQSDSIRFGIWENSDLPTIFVTNKYCQGAVSVFGAHVLSYIPAGQQEVLMMSKASHLAAPKAIRGGIPLCWPWFGGDPQPTHGTGRIQFWNVTAVIREADGSDTICLTLSIEEPHRLDASLKVNFGKKLSITLNTVNQGDTAFVLAEGIHTYFSIGEISQCFIHGLGGAKAENRVDNTEFVAADTFGFEAETDNIYYSTSAITIEDRAWNRKILVEKLNSNTSVVWNPWIAKSQRMPDFGDEEYHNMVCVEATNCAGAKINLEPGRAHSITQLISVL